jgi:hypothetical protein
LTRNGKFAFLDPVWFLTVDGKAKARAVKDHVDVGFAAAKHDGRPQSAGGPVYTFRPAALLDLPLLQHWLRTPEVVRWWGNAEEQAVLLREDMDEPRMVMRIVSFKAVPSRMRRTTPSTPGRSRILLICRQDRERSTRSLANRT